MAKRKQKDSRYKRWQEFEAHGFRFRINSIYGSSLWKHNILALDVFKDGEWQDYKFVEDDKVINYIIA